MALTKEETKVKKSKLFKRFASNSNYIHITYTVWLKFVRLKKAVVFTLSGLWLTLVHNGGSRKDKAFCSVFTFLYIQCHL